MIAWSSVLYASIMAIIDTGMLSIIKKISINQSYGFMIIPTILYACQPWLFLSSLKTETMTIMNLLWDLISDILVSLIGIFYFKEMMGG
jgi:multidrug transporter EmrE-like cation transporter